MKNKPVHEESSILPSELCRCISCATPLEYTPGELLVTCKSCHASKSYISELPNPEYFSYNKKQIEALTDLDSDYHSRPFEILSTHCPSCGAELRVKEDVTGRCIYCKSPFHIPFKKIHSGIEPAAMIPFEVTEKEALRKFRIWYRYNLSHWLFGMRLKFDSDERMTPIYVPSYLINANAHIQYKGKFHESSEAGEQSGEFDTVIHNIPVPTEESYANRLHWYSCSLLSWDIKSLNVFRPELIAGTSITSFYLDHDAVVRIAAEVLDKRFDTLAKEDMGGKIPVLSELNVEVSSAESIAVLLPVWRLKASYKDKPVWCLLNGVSGKFIARGPSPTKAQGYLVGTILFALFFTLALYQYSAHNQLKVGTALFAGVFTLFSVAAIVAGLRKVFGMPLAIGIAAASTAFYLFISGSHILILLWYGIGLIILYALAFMSYKLSSSVEFDESDFEQSDLSGNQ